MGADEAIVTDTDIGVAPIDVIVRQDRGAERHRRVLSDMDSTGIGLVELRTHGDAGSFADVHLPDVNEVLAAKNYHEVAHPLAYPGCQRGRHRNQSLQRSTNEAADRINDARKRLNN